MKRMLVVLALIGTTSTPAVAQPSKQCNALYKITSEMPTLAISRLQIGAGEVISRVRVTTNGLPWSQDDYAKKGLALLEKLDDKPVRTISLISSAKIVHLNVTDLNIPRGMHLFSMDLLYNGDQIQMESDCILVK